MSKSNKRKMTLKQVAEIAKISLSTASRILNGKARKYHISKETEQKVKTISLELNYMPNEVARSLRTLKTSVIGLVVPDISNPFYGTIAYNIEKEAYKFGYSVIFCNSQENMELEKKYLQLLQRRNIDGIIICPVGFSYDYINILYDNGTPIVVVDRYNSSVHCPYVSSDNFQGGFDATTYLFKCGHQQVACISGERVNFISCERMRGYREAHRQYGLPLVESFIVGSEYSVERGYIETKLLLAREKRPTAIFSLNNLLTFGVLKALTEADLKIPEDISVISFDEEFHSAYLSVAMTTVAQQHKEIAVIALNFLWEQMDNQKESVNKHILLSTQLILRASVKQISG